VRYAQGLSGCGVGSKSELAAQCGVRAMEITRFAATILAALGLTGSAPAGHVYHVTKRPAAHRTHQAQPLAAIFVAGHGWGHGIGLAQYGAYGYALHGWTYDKIVAHYYPGTTLGQSNLSRVRVLLAGHAPRAVISSQSTFVVRDAKGKKHKLAAGVQALGPGMKLRLAASKKLRALPGPLMFSAGSGGRLSFGGRAYRGALRVKRAGSGLQVVNVVGLESYLWGVVPSEMPQRWPAEALAAQAVVARTYALAHLHKGDFDLFSDTRSQVYGGIAAEAQSATDAVNETARQVVLYNDELADTYFFSSSGGKTANVQDVWPSSPPEPYLVSVPDPYDTLSPYHDWGPLRFSAKTIAKRLHVPGGRVSDFRANVTSSGRVRSVTFVGTNGERTATGADVRTALGLRSTWFHLGLLSLSNPNGNIAYGSAATLSGAARGVTRVTLESRTYSGTWKRGARLTVRNGAVAVTVRPGVTTDYRLESGGFRTSTLRVSVAPLVQLAAGADGVSVSGTVRPLLPGASVQVQRLGGGSWTTVTQTTVASDGSYAATLALSPGSYRARVTAGHGFAIGLSDTLVVQ
jgi:stage II sporulation protein D